MKKNKENSTIDTIKSELKSRLNKENIPINLLQDLKEEMKSKGNYLANYTEKSKNTTHIHSNIYWLLIKPFTYLNAYGNISKNKGSTTPGIDKKTVKGFSWEECEKIAKQMKNQTYNPTPVKRIWINKPGKKEKRPLGIPTIKDRIIQEAVRGILEAIYEPIFKEFDQKNQNKCNNFGFRPNIGCWEAIERLTMFGQGINMVIEGDIKGAYDNVNHDILLHLLNKKIKDKKFLNLIKKLLNAGIMDMGEYKHSLIGVPQGGIVSPLLFNIYMFELDQFIMTLFEEWENKNQDLPLQPNKDQLYQRIAYQTRKTAKLLNEEKDPNIKKILRKTLKQQQQLQFKIPSYNKNTLRKKYIFIRYADDWILGFSGSLNEANKIKERIKEFLKEKLSLQLSEEKTKITNIRKETIEFLGYQIIIQSDYNRTRKMVTRQKTKNGWQTIMRRTTSGKYLVLPNKTKILNNLTKRGFCQGTDCYPIGIRAWANLTEYQIVQKYNSIFMGLIQHYKKCNNMRLLNRVSYIMQYSCAKTLATRQKIPMPQIFNKYGKNLKINTTTTDKQKQIKEISTEFLTIQEWNSRYGHNIYKAGLSREYDPFKIITFWRTKFKAISFCCICGNTENIEMHHTNSIRKIGKKVKGFNLILQQINRKQIPVCKKCHNDITYGRYDSIKPSEMYDEALAKL